MTDPHGGDVTQSVSLLGKAVRHEWALDWDFLSVNHGSFGAAPRVVLAAQRDWQRRLEAQPGRFMRAVLPDALRHAAEIGRAHV